MDRNRRFGWWHELILGALLVLLFIVAAAIMPRFVEPRSQLLLSRHLWEMAILSLGMTLIIVSGGIDLSVGSAMGMCAVAFGMTFQATGSVPLSCIVCVLVGCAGGSVNGVLIARLRVHPLIVTLATYAAFRGIAEGVSQGASYSRFGDAFSWLARGQFSGLPFAGWMFGLLAVGYAVLLSQTSVGRVLYAMGHNENAVRFSGIAVDRIKFWLYASSGLLAGVAALVYISRFDTAKADAGIYFELDVITAVVVGGTAITGGRGNVLGTLLGLLLIHETRQFVGRYWRIAELKPILVGSLLIASILLRRTLEGKANDE